MVVYAIKLNNGEYYAGCYKQPAKTVLGAQLYRSKKTVETMTKTSVNFHHKDFKIVPIKIEEIDE